MDFTHSEIAQIVGEQTLVIAALNRDIAALQKRVQELTPKTAETGNVVQIEGAK